LKADGVHLGQDDLPSEQARRILGENAIIGLSTHTREQAKAALFLPIDYIAFGPIFQTSTKTDPDEVVGLEGLSRIKSLIGDFPLVAIGGITASNVQQVLEAGADSAAIISDLISDTGQITEKMRTLLDIQSRNV
jgi:thiamine-phosphate pyrophosphorylase